MRRFLPALFCLTLLAAPVRADTVMVAVAANFADTAHEVAKAFAARSGHQVILSFGATGQLYTQITQGAPFEVFLAADDKRPKRAVDEGYGVEGSVFTYAIGQLMLYSADEDLIRGKETLIDGDFEKIAIANPEAAPYGEAAVEAMTALGVYDSLKAKIVQGQSIAQTLQFIKSGNAELGFVALGQVIKMQGGSRWMVPQEFYRPIRQDAVLLEMGKDNPAATEFIRFLQGDEAGAIIKHYGYAREQQSSSNLDGNVKPL